MTCAAAGDGDSDKEPERDEGACRACALLGERSCFRAFASDGLYIGTYSNFFSDPAQLKGVVLFCGVLASFFSLGNIGAALLLPVLCVPCLLCASTFRSDAVLSGRYNRPIQWCVEAIVFGYPCK